MVSEFNGSQYAPQTILREDATGTLNRLSLSGGHTQYVPACNPTTCSACAPPGQSVQMFLPMLQRNVKYSGAESVSVFDTSVYRYKLSQGTV